MLTKSLTRALKYTAAAAAVLLIMYASLSRGPADGAVVACSFRCRGQRLDYNGAKPSSWLRGQYLRLETAGQVYAIGGRLAYTEGDNPVEVVFNQPVDPRPGWQVVKQPLNTWGSVPVYVTIKTRTTTSVEPPAFRMNGHHLKIVQLADLHLSSFDGVCRDQFPQTDDCKADAKTLQFVNKVLDVETPDLVMLTGDQVFGDDSFHTQSTILKLVAPLINRKIPYAVMFGNHDDEGSLNREELCEFYKTLPYCLIQRGPRDIDGVGNYALSISGNNSTPLNIYVMDSHKYSPNAKILPGYDWLKESQLEWIKQQKSMLPTTPLSMAFFHIPLPEHRNIDQGYVGNFKEGITAPKFNSGGRDVLKSIGVSVLSVGHDHCNDYCLLDHKEDASSDSIGEGDIWLCYGGGGGEGGYAGYGGTTRRIRVFHVDAEKQEIKTWKRLETTMEVFDEQVLVRNGQPVKA